MSIRVLCVARQLDRPATEMLIGIRRAGIELDVAYKPECPHYERLHGAGVPLIDVRIRSRLDRAAIKTLRNRMKSKPYDVLHGINTHAITCALRAARGIPLKVVCYRGYMGHVGYLRPSSWLSYLNPRVNRILCVSKAVERFFLGIRFFGKRFPPHKLVTIHKGHDLSWYQADPADLSEFGIPPEAFVAGFVGRAGRRKGIQVLVEALDHIPADYPIHLLLVGRVERNKQVMRQIEQSRLRERIHRTGFRTDAPELAHACDVFVMPSLEREGFSRSVMEAMGYGTPPIVSDAGGMPEQVEHGVSGLVVPQNDPVALAAAISRLYEEPETRATMGRNARERIARVFSSERTVREMIAVYRELTS